MIDASEGPRWSFVVPALRAIVARRACCRSCRRGFLLSDQNVRPVHRLLTLLYQTLGSIPNVLRPLPYFRRQRHAGKEMPAHTLGKIGSASWT